MQTRLPGVGDVTIAVPRNADVTFTGTTGVGEVAVADQQRDGTTAGRPREITDLGADGVAARSTDRDRRAQPVPGTWRWCVTDWSHRSDRDRRHPARTRLVSLLVGLLTLGMALAAFVGELPDLSGFDPRWLLAGGAAFVGTGAAGREPAGAAPDLMDRTAALGSDGGARAALGSSGHGERATGVARRPNPRRETGGGFAMSGVHGTGVQPCQQSHFQDGFGPEGGFADVRTGPPATPTRSCPGACSSRPGRRG